MKKTVFYICALVALALHVAASQDGSEIKGIDNQKNNAVTSPTGEAHQAVPEAMPSHSGGLTSEEWRLLGAARATALRSNPSLFKRAMELSQKMQDLQHQLDSEIVKIDPTVAPVVARIEHRMPSASNPSPGVSK